MIQVYTGDGKGKTTAAFGLAFRAFERGMKPVIVQFLKDGKSGETLLAKRLGITVYHSDIQTPPWEKAAVDGWQSDTLVKYALSLNLIGKVKLLVLDELLGAKNAGFINNGDIMALVKKAKNSDTELVITGRGADEELIEAADLVTEMRCVKHYFDAGVKARKGVEF